jgi:protein-S-isoprenylcysteine O-methyltransferase Ste14
MGESLLDRTRLVVYSLARTITVKAALMSATVLKEPTAMMPVRDWFVRNRVRLSVVIFTGFIVAAVLLGIRPHNVINFRDPVVGVGLLLVVSGVLIRTWAAGTLRKREVLVQDGPYKFIRHPLYLGSFLLTTGFFILCGVTLVLVLLVAPIFFAYVFAIRDEERFLANKFGADWAQYSARVPALIPWRIPSSANLAWTYHQWVRNREYQAMLASIGGLAGLYTWWALTVHGG